MPLIFITNDLAIQTDSITKVERQAANADQFNLTLNSVGPTVTVDKVQLSAIFKAEGQQPATEI